MTITIEMQTKDNFQLELMVVVKTIKLGNVVPWMEKIEFLFLSFLSGPSSSFRLCQ